MLPVPGRRIPTALAAALASVDGRTRRAPARAAGPPHAATALHRRGADGVAGRPRPHRHAPALSLDRRVVLAWLRETRLLECSGRRAATSRPDQEALMILSRDRILTTHVGSLPRNEKLSDLLISAGGRRSLTTQGDVRRRDGQGGAPRRATSRRRPASTSATTASSSASASRPTCRSACPASPASRKRRRGREFEEFPELMAYLKRRFPHASASSRTRRRRRARSSISTSSRSQSEIARFKRDRRGSRRVLRDVHDRALARHHLLHHAQRALRLARRLSRRDRARDEQRISGDPQGRA